MSAATDEACRTAINIARNAGYSVFPCRSDKSPACPHGFHDASCDPATILQLWHRYPGELIGVATGERSNLAVLDVDRKHTEALAWWQTNHPRLLPTRTFTTRSGGLHLHYRHRHGLKNTQGKICRGIDSRAEGGYVIYWFAAGFDCLDHTPPQPLPDWLFDELTYRPPPAPPTATPIDPDRTLNAILRRLAEAREGDRNGLLFWAACRLAERGIGQRKAEAMLLPIAAAIGLTEYEARRTIASAQGRNAA
jgi:hypothetical protein